MTAASKYITPSMEVTFGVAVGLALFPLLLLSAILAPQEHTLLRMAGSLAHAASVLCAITLMVLHVRSRSLALAAAAIVSALWLLKQWGIHEPYFAALFLLYVMAGASVALNTARGLEWTVAVVLVLCTVTMAIQLLGVLPWSSALALHGHLPDGSQIGSVQYPTLFVSAENLKVSWLQARPAGLFTSNQFATLFVLFAFALIFSSRLSSWYLPLALAIVAVAIVLTLSKAALLGSVIAALAAAALFRGIYTIRAALFVCFILGAYFVYSILFPGIFQTYLNLEVIGISAAIRIVDVLTIAGIIDPSDFWTRYQFENWAAEFGYIPNQIAQKVLSRRAEHGSPTSLVAASLKNPLYIAIFGVVTLGLVFMIGRTRLFSARLTVREVCFGTVLVIFSLSANFLLAPTFAAILGVALAQRFAPILFGTRQSECLRSNCSAPPKPT